MYTLGSVGVSVDTSSESVRISVGSSSVGTSELAVSFCFGRGFKSLNKVIDAYASNKLAYTEIYMVTSCFASAD